MSINPYFSWKRHVIRLMRDQGLPLRLTPTEIARMESFWYWGNSAEEFVETLKSIKEVKFQSYQG